MNQITTKDFLVFQIKDTAAQVREFYKGKKTVDEVKMEKMIMVIVGIFIFCNSLQVLNYIVKSNALELMADLLLSVNSSVNAIVYGIFSKKYQEMLLKTMHQACGITPQESIRMPNFGKFQSDPNQTPSPSTTTTPGPATTSTITTNHNNNSNQVNFNSKLN